MTFISEEDYKAFRQNCEKNGVKYKDETEYRQATHDIYALAEIALAAYGNHKVLQAQLEKQPGGFVAPANGRMCWLCYGGGSGEMWYDKLGLRCMDCETAYRNRLIPQYVIGDRDRKKFVSGTSLATQYRVNYATLRRLIRQGRLKPA